MIHTILIGTGILDLEAEVAAIAPAAGGATLDSGLFELLVDAVPPPGCGAGNEPSWWLKPRPCGPLLPAGIEPPCCWPWITAHPTDELVAELLFAVSCECVECTEWTLGADPGLDRIDWARLLGFSSMSAMWSVVRTGRHRVRPNAPDEPSQIRSVTSVWDAGT